MGRNLDGSGWEALRAPSLEQSNQTHKLAVLEQDMTYVKCELKRIADALDGDSPLMLLINSLNNECSNDELMAEVEELRNDVGALIDDEPNYPGIELDYEDDEHECVSHDQLLKTALSALDSMQAAIEQLQQEGITTADWIQRVEIDHHEAEKDLRSELVKLDERITALEKRFNKHNHTYSLTGTGMVASN